MTWRARLLRWMVRLALVAAGALAAVLLFHFVVMPLFVRHGQETRVPDVRGLTLPEAEALLVRADLGRGRVVEVHDVGTPSGRIVRQAPGSGYHVKSGRDVELVVSLGPATRRIPPLTGESLVHARFLLAREGIPVGKVREIVHPGMPAGHVLASSPAPGARLGRREAVDLLVTHGPRPRRYLMPDLKGREARATQEALEAAGLRVSLRIWRSPEARPNEIFEQTPPPGHPIDAGGMVEILTGG